MPQEVFQFEDVTVDLRRVSVSRAGQPVAARTEDLRRASLPDRAPRQARHQGRAARHGMEGHVRHAERADARRSSAAQGAWRRCVRGEVCRNGGEARLSVHCAGHDDQARRPMPAQGSRYVAAEPARDCCSRYRSGDAGRSPPLAVVACSSPRSRFGSVAMRDRRATIATHEAPQVQSSPRRFTTGSHSYSFPAISPDGRTVAYSSDRDGSMEIYTSGFTAGGKESALTNDGGQNMFADWSPDGQWIAYHSRKKGGIWIVPSGGGSGQAGCRFRIAAVVDARRRANRLHVRRGRDGGAVDSLDRAERRHRVDAS